MKNSVQRTLLRQDYGGQAGGGAKRTMIPRARCPWYYSSHSQFTSIEFTKLLLDADVQISINGKGRAFDNIFSERLWRTVKYEDVYLRYYQMVSEARYYSIATALIHGDESA